MAAIREGMKLRFIGIAATEKLKILLKRVLLHPPTRKVNNPERRDASDLGALDSIVLPRTRKRRDGRAPAAVTVAGAVGFSFSPPRIRTRG
jgi:hypothetical protein